MQEHNRHKSRQSQANILQHSVYAKHTGLNNFFLFEPSRSLYLFSQANAFCANVILYVLFCIKLWSICWKSNIKVAILRQLLSCSLLTSALVWQACKISVYITAWQQCVDISISHVTTWNNPVKNILQSILMTFCSLQSLKVIRVRLQTQSMQQESFSAILMTATIRQ